MTLLDLVISPALAQDGAAAGGSLLSTLAFPIILIAIMYFLMIRPQMKRAKEHKTMLSKLGVGDEVLTSGGIAGVVRALSDNFVTLEVADKVEIQVQRGAVGNILPKGTLKS